MVHTFQPTNHVLTTMAPRETSVAAAVPYAGRTKSVITTAPPFPTDTYEVAVPTSHSDHPLVRSFA